MSRYLHRHLGKNSSSTKLHSYYLNVHPIWGFAAAHAGGIPPTAAAVAAEGGPDHIPDTRSLLLPAKTDARLLTAHVSRCNVSRYVAHLRAYHTCDNKRVHYGG